MRLDERIGGVLVSPRATLARLAAGEARAGDVAWLMVAWLVASRLPSLAKAALLGRAFGVAYGLQATLAVTSAILPDVLGILVAGAILSLFVRATLPARPFDLASYAYVPYLTLNLLGSLYYSARGYEPSATAQYLVHGVGIAWGVVVWALALLAATKPEGAS